MNICMQAAVLSAALAKKGQSWRWHRGTAQGHGERGGMANHGSFLGASKGGLTSAWDLAEP